MSSSTGAEGLAPHAAVLPIPTLGHITPFLHLSRALASRGFVITFINTEGNHRDLKDIVSQEESFGYGGSIRFETVPGVQTSEADFTAPETRPMFSEALMAMQGPVESLLIRSMARDDDLVPPVSCFISDMLFPWSTEVPRRIGIPEVKFWVASASSILLYNSFPQMLEKGDIPVQDRSIEKRITYVDGLSPLPMWSLPGDFSASDDEPGFARRCARAKSLATTSWVLINSFEELEGSATFQAFRDISPKAIAVGPLSTMVPGSSNASLWTEDTESLSWLGKQSPGSVLYISLGSIATLSFDQFKEFSEGLTLLQRPFIWAIRPKSVAGMEPEFLERFKETVRSFGLVVSWAPQVDILRHPSTAGFLSHCGWNSILESVASAVPILCWPCVAEQNLNCKLIVEDWKIGLKFSRVAMPDPYEVVVARDEFVEVVVARDEFVEVVERFMGADSEHLRINVKKLSEEARRAVSRGGSSYENLERFAQAVKTS
ncbi:linamarin synthase 2-like [Selaginella moellendorffii]|uniref:linamarin synthase 2-like n=1 Tax=Selaginella moellendorffii TaxID=88036 RepID=UPI000D1C92BD|nr:linamarin synthase 2-like [Selaginella moellendorffii]|eukprot:XP_024526080.1 linamarin synthase 2-like [Selaginella moellendorffii]